MRIRGFFILLLGLSFSVQAQYSIPDTIPAGLPIPASKGNYIQENTVDTTITIVINEIMASNDGGIEDEYGEDEDWIEIYNYGDQSIPLNKLYFSDETDDPFKWSPASNEYIEPGEYVVIWADNQDAQGPLHTNFKLSSEGEALYLHYANSLKIDQLLYTKQSTNISYGRTPDAGLIWNYFEKATPAAPNNYEGSIAVLTKPGANLQGGIYNTAQLLRLNSPEADAEIRYTLDCTDPTEESTPYEDEIHITETTVVKARAFKEDAICSPVLTLSFIYCDKKFENPVLSLVGNPEDLFGRPGIFENNSLNIEIPTHIEFFVNGRTEFRSGAGLQQHSSKTFKPKSVRLYARSRYDESWFNYRFFEENGAAAYKRLVLRNSGNDNITRATTNVNFRDAFIQKLGGQSNIDPWISRSRPVNVFLNGEYYGILNMRERIDEYYIQSYSGEEEFDLLERAFKYPANQHAIYGEEKAYNDLLAKIDTVIDSMSDEGYQFIDENIDIKQFTDYWLTEVFVGNYDWLSNNMKFWKPVDHGKWRWIYWDTDHGIGLKFGEYGLVEWNTLEWSLSNHGRSFYGRYNRLQRKLLMNFTYKDYFIKRYSALLNTSFDTLQTLPLLNSMMQQYEKDMVHHLEKWNKKEEDWYGAIELISSYLKERPQIQFEHLQRQFYLPDPVDVSIEVFPKQRASIEIEGANSFQDSLNLKLFPGLDYKVKIKPQTGYTIDHWSIDSIESDSALLDFKDIRELQIYLRPIQLDTLFELSEIYFNNKEAYDAGDWIELFYKGDKRLDINNFYLSDKDNKHYEISSPIMLTPNNYFVLVEDEESFKQVFPDALHVSEVKSLSLHESSSYYLHASNGDTLMGIYYEKENNWPSIKQPGYSIERKDFQNQSTLGSSWEISVNEFGSPEKPLGEAYYFQAPSSINKELPNDMARELDFLNSNSLYSDPDGHPLGAIWIEDYSGPGFFYFGSHIVSKESYYPAGNLLFTPGGKSRDTTFLKYKVLDATGQASELHELIFRAPNSIQEKQNLELKIYPNPVKDYCIIERMETQNTDIGISLYNAAGVIVSEYILEAGTNSIRLNTEGLNAGFYLLRLEGESGGLSSPVIINK